MHRRLIAISALLFVVPLATTIPAVAKNSHTFNLDRSASLNGTPIAAGSYKVSWETRSPEATVTFVKADKSEVVATAHARLVDRGRKFDRNTIVYDENPDGSRSIVEIRIAGMKQALVFGEAASTQ